MVRNADGIPERKTVIIDLADQMSVDATIAYCSEENNFLKIGITSGCFDSLHYYHLVYLMRCKAVVDILVVGVDSDRKIREEKGPDRPIVNERHRLMMVNALKYVDACFVLEDLKQFGEMCNRFINFRPKEFGYVFRNQEWLGREKEVIIGNTHAQVVIVPDIEELTSTSEMVRKIEEQIKKREQQE